MRLRNDTPFLRTHTCQPCTCQRDEAAAGIDPGCLGKWVVVTVTQRNMTWTTNDIVLSVVCLHNSLLVFA
jgi:hypothetical protein